MIRLATREDMPRILELYTEARAFMARLLLAQGGSRIFFLDKKTSQAFPVACEAQPSISQPLVKRNEAATQTFS